MPNVIPTDPLFDDPILGRGKLLLSSPLSGGLIDSVATGHVNQVNEIDIENYTGVQFTALGSGAFADGVALDGLNEVQADCKAAHYSMLTQTIYGYPKGSVDWATTLPTVAARYDPFTTGLNPDHFLAQLWGQLDVSLGFGYLPFTTAKWYGTRDSSGAVTAFAPCNAGLQVPGGRGQNWGLTALKDFNTPSAVSNRPPMQSGGGSNVAARQSVVLQDSSSALLTVSGVSETPSLSVSGGVEVALSNCSDDRSSCAATLGASRLTTGPFSFQGYDVAALTINDVTAPAGSLSGTTLIFSSISGTVRVTLTDGRYSDMPVQTGVIVATWDASARKATMAFAFESTLNDGTEINLDGTAFGSFDNTAPTATVVVASPAAAITGGTATVECASPTGTTVTVDGSQSSDREDGTPRLAWWVNDFAPVARRSTSPQLVLPNLPLGSQDVLLMAYDSRGYAGSSHLQVSVVDTTAPVITAQDVCAFPPDKKEFCVQLGHELQAEAVDQCDGDVTSSLRITSVSSSTGMGVVSFNDTEACLIADRTGAGSGTSYSITLAATDQSGTVGTHTVTVRVPHNGPTRDCLQPSKLEGAFR